jgi:tetratricopeptide (TPR) repeat protein
MVGHSATLVLVLAELGRFAEAAQVYQHALPAVEKLLAEFPPEHDEGVHARRWVDDLQRRLTPVAWYLATGPDLTRRDAALAVGLATKALEISPAGWSFWRTLGVAHYRSGDFEAAVEVLEKAAQLPREQEAIAEFFFLAMAHWQLGDRDQARQWYDRAAEWMAQNAPDHQEFSRFRAEAAELLGVNPEASPGPAVSEEP